MCRAGRGEPRRVFLRPVYNTVPQLALMGANDSNDAAHEGGDAYSAADVTLIRALFGTRMLPECWDAVQRAYAGSGASIQFVIHPRVGHGVDERIFGDLTRFFEAACDERQDLSTARGQDCDCLPAGWEAGS